MKLRDLKIGTQLPLGLGIVLAFVVLLGVVAWVQSDLLWQETSGLYDHPLTVRRALGEITADILVMQRGMKDVSQAGSEPERQAILQSVDSAEADAAEGFQSVAANYLGPQTDVDQAHQAFIQWKAIREETLRLVYAARYNEAMQRTAVNGVESSQVNRILDQIGVISDFAKNRADQFYADATQLSTTLKLQLGIFVTAILLLTIGIGYLLLKGIRNPLQELTAVTDQFREGNLDARSQYRAANEFGSLAVAFNQMAATVQADLRVKENAAQLAGVMLREEELLSFCQKLLQGLLEHTGSQMGAIYLLNEPKTAFEHYTSIGLGANRRSSFSATLREGEFGAALVTQRIQHLGDLPADTHLTFSAVSGDFMPREIITIPIASTAPAGEGAHLGIIAIISLASMRSYAPAALQLVNEIWGVLTARLNGVLAFRQARLFSERLEQQNRELEAQQKELAAQTDELTRQNTELEMQKRQLDEANHLKSSFLSNMSHELRTPLNSVIALSGVLSRRLVKTIPADEYSYLEIIERNGKHLLEMINDILDLSRIEAGREEVSLTRFPVRGLVHDILTMVAPLANEKRIALSNEVSDELAPITSDLEKCRHILQNLVGNAVKFTDAGTVAVSAQQVDTTLSITVSDTGIGIAAEKLPYIFDEFRQGDESTSRKYGGSGLGLAIASKYANLLHGSISVESTPGQGSAFTLTLPLRITAPNSAVDPVGYSLAGAPKYRVPETPLAHLSGIGHSILLVEDTEPMIIQMSDILMEQGYETRVARNGKEALEKIKQGVPEAVILDLMMPEVDGFQVLKAIRSTQETVGLPVLILTARHVSREELSFLTGNHIHQLIQKGDISRADLLAAVAQMVAPPQAERLTPVRHPIARKTPLGRPVVLIVEDNPDNLRTARALLQDSCDILEAVDGKAGLELARRCWPDLILMDLALPGMDGYTVLAALRADVALCHIPVVAITASAMKGDREQILAHGFDGYISKPIDEKMLQETLDEVLNGE